MNKIDQQLINSHLETIRLLSRALDKINPLSPYFQAEDPLEYHLIELRNERKNQKSRIENSV